MEQGIEQSPSGIRFPVIGIGASAGGFDPFETILKSLPDQLNAAIVFIQHLSTEHTNNLPEILKSKFPPLHIVEIYPIRQIMRPAA